MTNYRPGDVVLILFPFTDLAAIKKRPALVVSPRGYTESYGDIVVIAITSAPQPGVDMKIEEWRAAGLIKESWLKPVIGTVAVARITKKLGSLVETDRARASTVVAELIAKEFLP
jgi:mRNA interferase MazF